jgi:hypothetical protein
MPGCSYIPRQAGVQSYVLKPWNNGFSKPNLLYTIPEKKESKPGYYNVIVLNHNSKAHELSVNINKPYFNNPTT